MLKNILKYLKLYLSSNFPFKAKLTYLFKTSVFSFKLYPFTFRATANNSPGWESNYKFVNINFAIQLTTIISEFSSIGGILISSIN